MNETLTLVLSGGAGLLLGAIFFGGLWWTVNKGVSSQRPAFWFLGSFLVRMSITLTGFYFIGRGNWQRLLLCLLGFLTARVMVTWMTRPLGTERNRRAQEVSHAPESR